MMAIQTSFRLSKRDFAKLEFSCFEVIGAGPFHYDPGFEQLRCAASQSIFQIKKAHPGSGRTSTPLLGLQP